MIILKKSQYYSDYLKSILFSVPWPSLNVQVNFLILSVLCVTFLNLNCARTKVDVLVLV